MAKAKKKVAKKKGREQTGKPKRVAKASAPKKRAKKAKRTVKKAASTTK